MNKIRRAGVPSFIWLMVMAFSGCASWEDANATESSLSGKVTLTPTCGGPQQLEQNCNGPYANAKIQILDKTNSLVAHTTTDADGKFELVLASGIYKIHVDISAMYRYVRRLAGNGFTEAAFADTDQVR